MFELDENQKKSLDLFESTLENGLCKICGIIEPMSSPDIDHKWDIFIKDYVADAIENIHDYPEAAIGFSCFLGMAVAHNWDKDYERFKNRGYKSYYGSNGYDDMDDHILENVLKLGGEDIKKTSDRIQSCAFATIELLKHEQIEMGTAYGFYALSRCYTVLFRLGVSIELKRLGYRKEYAKTFPSV